MKAERRQELKTNELGAFLVDSAEWAQKHSTQIGGAAAVIIVVSIAINFFSASRSQAISDSMIAISDLSFTESDADSSFAALDDIIDGASSREVKAEALVRKGASAMNLVRGLGASFNPDYLDEAADAYSEIVTSFPDRMPMLGMALGALATIEEDRFVTDGDIQHKENARKYLERLVNEPKFKGTPFQATAAERLKDIDEVFQQVAIAEALPAADDTAADANGNNTGAIQIQMNSDGTATQTNADGTTTTIPTKSGTPGPDGGDETDDDGN